MHFNYALIMVQVFVSFMYGMALPILFFIALVALFNMYVSERLMLAYWFRQPPNYDNEILHSCLHTLNFAPILMFALGFW